jgi:N-sulfoglucosamine sulfohydrolase
MGSSRRGIGSAGRRPLSTVVSGLVAMALLLAIGTEPLASVQGKSAQRPNILVLVADDLGWRDVGPYGNGGIRTPNLDRLARSGLRVVHAFGTSPQCSPSRISTLSGKYSHATRTEDLHTPLPESERLVPSYLQANGYFTGMMAKTHMPRRRSPVPMVLVQAL